MHPYDPPYRLEGVDHVIYEAEDEARAAIIDAMRALYKLHGDRAPAVFDHAAAQAHIIMRRERERSEHLHAELAIEEVHRGDR